MPEVFVFKVRQWFKVVQPAVFVRHGSLSLESTGGSSGKKLVGGVPCSSSLSCRRRLKSLRLAL
jgi:hypothetical protein